MTVRSGGGLQKSCRIAPSQGGGCQVALSSCLSYEEWPLLLDFFLVNFFFNLFIPEKRKRCPRIT